MVNFIGVFIILGVILVSMMFHELAHGGVAYLLGDTTAKEDGRLTLNPLKHVDPFMSIILPVLLYLMKAPVFGGAKPVPVDFSRLKGGVWGMALVAIVGPLVNFLLALICFLFMYATNVDIDGIFGMILYEGVVVNLGFMVFNLLPIPPLDGSRLLYFLAPDGARIVLERFERYGFIAIYIMILLCGGLFSSLIGNIIGDILRFFYFLVGNV